MKKLKNRKSPGPDDISNEMIKYGDNGLINQLTLLLQTIFAQLEIPSDWKVSTIIPVFKKGNKKDPENYRGIHLLNSTLKLLSKLVLNKLLTHKEKQRGCPLLDANRYTHIYISYICVYILFICLRL